MSISDREGLRQYLERKLEASDLEITNEWKNIEGWSMETFSLGLRYSKNGAPHEQEIIIRKEPVSGLLEPYDVSIEYRVLKALMDTEMATPDVYWYEPDPQVMGLPFYVMEKVGGYVHWAARKLGDNSRLIPDDQERASLAEDFIENIAILHKCDYKALGLEFLGEPGPGKGSALLQVERWEEVLERAGFRNKPIVAYTLHWMKDNLPENDRPIIVHGDYRTGNYISLDHKIAAVLDWEMVHLGDPMEDISYIIGSAWRSPKPDSWVSHLLPLDEFYEKYTAKTGIPIDPEKIKFYHILNALKGLGIAATAANAFNTKQNPDLRPGVFSVTWYASYFVLVKALNKYLAD